MTRTLTIYKKKNKNKKILHMLIDYDMDRACLGDILGYAPSTMSTMLSKELPEAEQDRIIEQVNKYREKRCRQ